MSYVESHLMIGERIIYQARLHSLALLGPIVSMAIGVLIIFSTAVFSRTLMGWVPQLAQLSAGSGVNIERVVSMFLMLIGGVWALSAAVRLIRAITHMLSSEFAVTNRRVIVKTGFLQQATLELLLSKVESINIAQSMWGRMFNYGNIVLSGTGTTHKPLPMIADPLEFRRQIQRQITDKQTQPIPAQVMPVQRQSFPH